MFSRWRFAIYSGLPAISLSRALANLFGVYAASIANSKIVQSPAFGSLARNNSQQGMRLRK
ncbi:MAG: hypothetical protein DME67_07965 [Verrucomicrobia bacterium]|nr:MAG: hypothetical protein DME67_07965 [Verrucomicrobiota bacterium]